MSDQPKKKTIVKFWQGPGARAAFGAVYQKLVPDDNVSKLKKIFAVHELRNQQKNELQLPGPEHCFPGLVRFSVKGRQVRFCKQRWCPHCYARKLAAVFQWFISLREKHGYAITVSVERWRVPKEFFYANTGLIWDHVRPVRPAWAGKSFYAALSCTVMAANSEVVVISRRTLGTAQRNFLQYRTKVRKGKTIRQDWGGDLLSHSIQRIDKLSELSELFRYPGNWLRNPESKELFDFLALSNWKLFCKYQRGRPRPAFEPLIKPSRRRTKKRAHRMSSTAKQVRELILARQREKCVDQPFIDYQVEWIHSLTELERTLCQLPPKSVWPDARRAYPGVCGGE